LAKHVANYKDYKIGKYPYVTSFTVIENDDYDIILLQHVENCKSKDEFHARERYYIENNECVNKCIPNRTKQEYREQNKDKIKEYSDLYCQKNKDRIKVHRDANKLIINEKK
jgi:hypothetical protein